MSGHMSFLISGNGPEGIEVAPQYAAAIARQQARQRILDRAILALRFVSETGEAANEVELLEQAAVVAKVAA